MATPKNVTLVSTNRTVSPRSPILSDKYNATVKETNKDLSSIATELNEITKSALKLHTNAWDFTVQSGQDSYHGIDAYTIYWDARPNTEKVTIEEHVTSEFGSVLNDLTIAAENVSFDITGITSTPIRNLSSEDRDVQHVLKIVVDTLPLLLGEEDLNVNLSDVTVDDPFVPGGNALYTIGTVNDPWENGYFKNLTVTTMTTLSSNIVEIGDKNIVLASGATSKLEADGGGITLKVGTGSGVDDVRTILYDEGDDKWDFNVGITVNGTAIQGALGPHSVNATHIDWEDDNDSRPHQINTDNIPEGTTNLWYTDTNVDARIALANLSDLLDVDDADSSDNGFLLSYNNSTTRFEWIAPANTVDVDVDTTNLRTRLAELDNGSLIVIGDATNTIVKAAGNLEAVGSVTGSTFTANQGAGNEDGYKFASVNGNKAGLQYNTASTLLLNSEQSVHFHLNRNEVAGANFIVEDWNNVDLFKIDEATGDCWVGKGDLTISQGGIEIVNGDFNAQLIGDDSSGTPDTLTINLDDTAGSGSDNQLYLDINSITASTAKWPSVRISPSLVAVGSSSNPALRIGAGNLGFYTEGKDGHIRNANVGGILKFEATDVAGTGIATTAEIGNGKLVIGGSDSPKLVIQTDNAGNDPVFEFRDGNSTDGIDLFYDGSGETFEIVGHPAVGNSNLLFQLNADRSGASVFAPLSVAQGLAVTGNIAGTEHFLLSSTTATIGIGVTALHPIHHTNQAHLTTGGVWTDSSSRTAKKNIKNLSQRDADAAFAMLAPKKFEYKVNGEKHLGFIAEDVHDLVATEDRKGLSSMDIVAVLAKVMQKQSKTLDKQSKALSKQQKQISKLEKALKAKK